jgi:serine/threonine-protein kinase
MPPLSRQSAPFQLGDWCVDPATGLLTRGTEVRRARALVADLLLYFAARAGEVVTKDELVAGPWGGAAIADSALTSTIAELRELLDDQPRSPRYIQTLPKRGYRLIASVGVPQAIEPVAPAPPAIASDAAAATSVQPPVAPGAHRLRRSWTLAFGLGMAFAVAVTVTLASRRRPVEPAPAMHAMRLTVDLPKDVRLASDSIPRLALAPDGSRMAYVARTSTGIALYTRTLDQFEARAVAGTSDARAPFFSPDGSRIGYFANSELRSIPISGGEPTILCPARVALGASWGPDDTVVFSGADGAGLFEVPATGGHPHQLTTMDRTRGELTHRWPQVLPDGVHVLFTALEQEGRADVVAVSRQTGERHVVVENAQAAMFMPPARLVFERHGRLMAATIDPDRLELTGPPRVIVQDAATPGPGYGPPLFAVASGGALVYVPLDPHDTDRELVWVDRTGHASPTGAPPRSYMHPRLSRDDKHVLTWMRTDDPDLWLLDLASHALTRLVTGVPARRAAWSPDGLHVLFDAPGPENPVTLYEADIGGGTAHRLNAARNSQYAGTWTPDGRTIAYLDLTRATGFDIVTMGTEPQTPATPLLHSPANETGPAFSPDGRWLAFVSDTSKREEVYLVPYPLSTTATPVQVSTHGGREPVWSKRGDELFYRQGQTMCTVHVTGTDRPRVSDPEPLFTGEFDQRPASHPNYDVAADGRFLMIRGTAPPTTDTRIAVLLRWDVP